MGSTTFRKLFEPEAGGGTGEVPPEYLTETEGDARYKPLLYVPAWTDITGKPSVFPPESHSHRIAPRTVAANTTLTVADELVLVDASAGAVIIALPTAAGIAGKKFEVKKIDSSTNTVTVDPAGTETIDDKASISTTVQNDAAAFRSDGTNYRIVSPVQAAGTTGGGGGAVSILDQIYALFDVNADPVDALISSGAFRAFVFFSSHNAASWKAAINAAYTVPAGKKLIVVQKGGAQSLSDATNRQARLRNTTDAADVIPPVDFAPDKAFGLPWLGDLAVASMLTEVAAGKAVRLELFNGNAQKRAMGAFVICREVTA